MYPLPLRVLDAPYPAQKGFRPSPSGRPRVSQPSCMRLIHPTRCWSLRSSMFGPSLPAHQLLCPLLTSFLPSPRITARLALGQKERSPRISRMCFYPIHPSHLQRSLPDDYWTLSISALLSRDRCLLCASCSSGRECAYTFLQTSPRGDSSWCSAYGSRHQGP